MRRLSQLVPLVVTWLVAAGGCSRSTQRPFVGDDAGPRAPAPARDGGTSRDGGTTPRADAGVDGGRRDDCWDVPIDFAHTQHGNGGVPASAASDLPVGFGLDGSCWCGEELSCEAHYRPGAGILDLRTRACAEFLCDACFRQVGGTCRVPSMGEGPVPVFVNGAYAFEISSTDAVPAIGPVEQALTVPDSTTPGCPPAPMTGPTLAVDGACVPTTVEAGVADEIRLSACVPCGHLFGTCVVDRTANVLHVRPRSTPTECDVDCRDDCAPEEGSCVIPPLEPGAYTLDVPGHGRIDLAAVEAPRDRDEVCLGDL